MNKKGEAITIGIVAFSIIVGVLGFIAGSTGIRKIIPGLGGDKKIVQTHISRSESKPVILTGADGKPYILEATKEEVKIMESLDSQKMSLWQKLTVLPKLWLLLMILGIFFPPVAGIMGVINRRLYSETKKIVGGVEDSIKALENKPEEKQKILDTLSKRMDSSTKKLVSDIKREL